MLAAQLAACRADRQRLISENAGLLVRAIQAEETLARLAARAAFAQDECSTDRVRSRSVGKGRVASELSVTEP
jgi:hypothetical protein